MSVVALGGGSFIFLGVIVVFFFVIVYSYYTYRASAINARRNSEARRSGSFAAASPSMRSRCAPPSGCRFWCGAVTTSPWLL